jgi:hypothetical protein
MAFGVGASLASYGQGQQQEAAKLMGVAAKEEEQRNVFNTQQKAAAKEGNTALGSTLGGLAGGALAGAEFGSAAGPWGTLIGGALGALAGGLFTVMLAVLLVVSSAFPSTAEATMIHQNDLTQLELHQALSYDPGTGIFTWVEPAAARTKPGDRAGYEKKGTGYRYIKINSRAHAEHRLAWLYMTGMWPLFEIDHRNRVHSDNRFDNLRPATRKQNCENREARKGALSGFRGVSWSNNKWHAVIMHFGVQKSLGHFSDIEDAKKARLAAEAELFTHSPRVSKET